MRIATFLIALISVAIISGCSNSQRISRTKPVPKQVIVDEYAVLDDGNKKPISDRELQKKLEEARASYAQALRYSDQSKTVLASKFFEKALATLNDLVTYPNIASNDEFASLSENVIRDYEERTSIDSLDANSNFFVLRDKMLQDIGSIPVAGLRNYNNVKSDATSSYTIEMTDNPAVQQCVSYLTSDRGRKFFTKWMERTTRFFPMYNKIMQEEGAPLELRYLSIIESGLNPVAVSRAKAVGLWQFISSSGSLYGLRQNWWVDERRNPEKETRAAARYLMDLYEEFGDWHLALGSYNCGPGRMKSAISRSGGSRDYWVVRNFLPRETQRYVPLYIAASKIASDPEAYGFTNLNYEKPDEYKTLSLDYSMDFSGIASALEITTDELRNLNLELLRGRTPPGQYQYPLRVPASTGDDLIAAFKQQTDSMRNNLTMVTYKVGKGESLAGIAKKYNVQPSDIYAYNAIRPPAGVRKGMSLRIPVSKNALQASDTVQVADSNDDDAGTAESAAVALRRTRAAKTGTPAASAPPALREVPVPAEANKPDTSDQSSNLNRRKSGGPAISQNSRPTAPPAVVASKVTSHRGYQPKQAYRVVSYKNHSRNQNTRYVSVSGRNSRGLRYQQGGRQPIFVYAGYHSGRRQAEPVSHKVRRGETLTGLASAYGVSAKELKRLNPRAIRRDKVLSGTTLKLKGATKAYQPVKAKQGSKTTAISRKKTTGLSTHKSTKKHSPAVAPVKKNRKRV